MKTISEAFLSVVVPVALFCSVTFADAQNIVANPGFETGNFFGWTQGGLQFFGQNVVTAAAHSGMFGASMAPGGGIGTLSQMLATTTVGQTYDLSFWLQNVGGSIPPPTSFSVSFNGVTVMTLTNPTAFGYTQFTFNGLLATGNSTLLEFGFRNDPFAWRFDDVSVVPGGSAGVPETGTSWLLLGLGLAGLCVARHAFSGRIGLRPDSGT